MFDFSAFDPAMFGGEAGAGGTPPVLPPQMPPIPPPVPIDPALTPPTVLPPVQALDQTNPLGMPAPGPQVTITPPPAPPPIRPPVSPTSGAPRQADQDLGSSIGGTPTSNPVNLGIRGQAPGEPLDITSQAQRDGTSQAPKPPSTPGSRLADVLKGVKAPETPKPMPLAAPHLTRAPPIKTGGLQALFAALSPQSAGGIQGLPSTLGQAIRR